MNARVWRTSLLVLGVLALSAFGSAGVGMRAAQPASMDLSRIGVADLASRLAALNESDPEAYFLLGGG
jgi:hypothetical protein